MVATPEYIKEFKGETLGIRLKKRSSYDYHIVMELIVEDDGQWLPLTDSVSTYYIDELKGLLEQVDKYLKTQKKVEYGYEFETDF